MMSERRSGLVAGDLELLLDRIKNMKELFFYCLLRPRVVSEWMNWHLFGIEKKSLQRFYTELAGLYFSHGMLTEDDIVAMQTHLYFLQQERDAKAKVLLSHLPALSTLLEKQQTIWRERYQRLSVDGVLLWQEILQMQSAVNKLRIDLSSLKFPQELSDERLQAQFQSVLHIMNAINQQLMEVEQAAYGLNRLHVLRTATAMFVTDGKECELNHVLKEQEGMAAVLLRHVDALLPLQKKFVAYLQSRARGMTFFSPEIDQSASDVSATPRPQV